MTAFTIAQTARHLGVSDSATRKMIGRAELSVLPGADPIRLDAGHVAAVLKLRQMAAVHDLTRRGSTAVRLARETRAVLLPGPRESKPLPDRAATSWNLRMSLVSVEARTLFGVAALTAVGAEDGCRWCLSSEFARVLGGWAPESYGEGFAVLFGQEPCERCAAGLYGAVLASLQARVHPGRHRPPDARAEAVAAALPAAAAPRPQRAQPMQDVDDGKAMVARRRREVQARLTAAKRAGDQRYALQLRQTLTALTADAARVDGRPAAVRPGKLACGHALAAGCSCPRRASKRSTS